MLAHIASSADAEVDRCASQPTGRGVALKEVRRWGCLTEAFSAV